MSFTLPDSLGPPRIEPLADALLRRDVRLDVSALVGLDVDLVLGPVGGDADGLAEYTRLVALVDMVDAGFIADPASLDLIAGLVEDLEDGDNRRGFEPEEFAGGWAA